ncbi:GTP 3',8-cyclase MoaA [archaeon]|nr:GTP 3',8-cyclase MoaA [archaeon]
MLVDPFGRIVDSIRIQVTTKCNLRCFYCHKEGCLRDTPDALTPNDVDRLITVAKQLGIHRVKFTGGEPLLRPDIDQLVTSASKPGVEVSMTTNGVFLSKWARVLQESGLARVNISLPSLDPSKYQSVTGFPIDPVLDGIRMAIDQGLSVKINVVVLRGINDDELEKFVDFARQLQVRVQFIELEPVVIPRAVFQKYYYPAERIHRWLRERAHSVSRRKLHARLVYDLGGVMVEVVGPINRPEFCMNCRRIRVTADGYLRPCLRTTAGQVPVLPALRSNEWREKVALAIKTVVKNRRPFISNT